MSLNTTATNPQVAENVVAEGPPHLGVQIERLHGMIEMLGASIGRLEERLAPVLDANDDVVPAEWLQLPPRSGYSASIAGALVRIDQIDDAVRALHQIDDAVRALHCRLDLP